MKAVKCTDQNIVMKAKDEYISLKKSLNGIRTTVTIFVAFIVKTFKFGQPNMI